MTLVNNCLTPSKGTHLKNKEGQIFEGCIYLGCLDCQDNYVEVSDEEYQASIIKEDPLCLDQN